VPECTNLSVGYHGQHGPKETLDIGHCEQLLAAMLELGASRLIVERDPSRYEDDRWSWHGGYRGQGDDFADLVADYPMLAACLLEECGVSLEEVRATIWAEEMDRSSGYRSLMVAT